MIEHSNGQNKFKSTVTCAYTHVHILALTNTTEFLRHGKLCPLSLLWKEFHNWLWDSYSSPIRKHINIHISFTMLGHFMLFAFLLLLLLRVRECEFVILVKKKSLASIFLRPIGLRKTKTVIVTVIKFWIYFRKKLFPWSDTKWFTRILYEKRGFDCQKTTTP